VISRQIVGFSRHRLAIVANTVVFAAVADKRNPQHLGEITERIGANVQIACRVRSDDLGRRRARGAGTHHGFRLRHDSCGQFIAAIGDVPPGKYREVNTAKGVFVSEHRAHEEWLMGFVTGFNYAHPTDGDDMERQITKLDIAALDLWMRNWCKRHPTNSLFEGMNIFIAEMKNWEVPKKYQ
jgi:hypothetical protein